MSAGSLRDVVTVSALILKRYHFSIVMVPLDRGARGCLGTPWVRPEHPAGLAVEELRARSRWIGELHDLVEAGLVEVAHFPRRGVARWFAERQVGAAAGSLVLAVAEPQFGQLWPL